MPTSSPGHPTGGSLWAGTTSLGPVQPLAPGAPESETTNHGRGQRDLTEAMK